ncbi:DUF2510 domain-containing protein [Demequina aurantiaca]|uniref:DUF2510 domain-containing protein n=1 Tax=Demequina aurantiaca TaxID=676200 RepID=UPI000783542F|nr:DUF2510 domain-containing protein [Demequina aurantiaca]
MSDVAQPRSGWYLDPENQDLQRYWDGSAWTTKTAPAPGSTQPAAPGSAQPAAPESTQPTAATTPPQAPAGSEIPTSGQAPAAPVQSAETAASEPERPSRRIGRGTIVVIFVGAIAIAIGGSMLLTGGFPS